LTRIWARSFAITKSTGAWKDAATVCPTSTLREITTPSMGVSMTVWLRSTSAWFTFARAWLSAASLALTEATAPSWLAFAVSSSVSGSSFWPASSFARSYFCRMSSTVARERSTLAFAASRLAWAWPSRAWRIEGSSRAMTWPFFTVELKSAYRLWMVPETWEPIWTVVTASRMPVAPTTSTTSPRSTAPRVNCVRLPSAPQEEEAGGEEDGTRRSQRRRRRAVAMSPV
jgi:hypothetical protein